VVQSLDLHYLVFLIIPQPYKYSRSYSILTMKQQEMQENLTKQAQEIAQELQQLEKDFNIKKEQFIRIQGALEVLKELGTEEE